MKLSEFIRSHKQELLSRWSGKVVVRLGLGAAQKPQLIDELPQFLDEVIECLDTPPETWNRSAGAEAHGRDRITIGIDIGALAEEFGIISETVFELLAERGEQPSQTDAAVLSRLIARGTAESVRAYARLRDKQFEEAAARHFSFMAHELRTPLHAARLALHLLELGHGEVSTHLGHLRRANEQLTVLVDEALARARVSGQTRINPEVCTTHDLMREAIANGQPLAEGKNITLSLDGDDVELVVDRRVFVSALTNLVVNAVKFSKQDGSVTIRSRLGDARMLFEIDDECGGLPEDLPAKMFQPFVQAGSDRTGFGLGLVIVKHAIDAHAGAVRVVDRSPHGCRFVLELPTIELPTDK